MTKIINVYFNGTDDANDIPLNGRVTLADLLNHLTVTDESKHTICVNGCGVDTKYFRDFNGIFAFHQEDQVIEVAKGVQAAVSNSIENVVLNVFGFSRGAAAAFLLAQKLKHIPSSSLTINIAAIEPVPGNFVTAVYGDMLLGVNMTLSAAVADLTKCHNIENMLVLFTNEPLPDFVCHAPILPAFPQSCKAEVDVVAGCHKNAVHFYKDGNAIHAYNTESEIVFFRIVEFMKKCGTTFDFSKYQLDASLTRSKEVLLPLHDYLAAKHLILSNGRKRSMHLNNTIFTATEKKKYLNRYHQQLSGVENINDNDSVLSIQDCKPQRMTPSLSQKTLICEAIFVFAILFVIYSRYFNNHDVESNHQFRSH